MTYLCFRSKLSKMQPYFAYAALTLATALFSWGTSFAQCNTTPCQIPVPQVNPLDACILPSPAALDCYYGVATSEPPVAFPPWCGVINNNHWFAFTADAVTATFNISVFDCSSGNGMQAAIFSTSDCENFTLTSNCLGNIPTETTQTLTATDLTPGQVYYLCIDGSGSNTICGYAINAVVPSVHGPTDNICIPTVQNNTYTTAGPSVWHINPPTAGNIIGSNIGSSIEVEWLEPGGAAQVCAQNIDCLDAPEFCLDVNIKASVVNEEFAVICPGETYPFFGLALNTSGDYDGVLTGSNGCDSTITLHLTVLPPVVTNLTVGICSGTAFLFNGDTLTESGTYLDTLTAENGCDSLLRLKLDVVAYFDVQQTATICDGETYEFGGIIFDNSGVYVDSLTAIGGCDSVVTLTLTILPPLSSHLDVSICEGSKYLFHGDTLSTAGMYVYPETGSFGCDSLVVLNLQTVLSFETMLEATICNGETYTLGTQRS